MDTILQYIQEKWPTVFIFLVLLIGAIYVTIKITKALKSHEELEKKCQKMQCDDHTAQLSFHKEEMKKLDEKLNTLDEIKESITAIQSLLLNKYPKVAGPLFSQKYSPRRLNEKGKEIFNSFSGEKFLNENAILFFDKIEAKKPKTALDVEQDALEVLYGALDSDIFNEIKLKVYNSKSIIVEKDGKNEEYSLTMNDICFIFSLELRDMYLKEHPEVPQNEE